MSICDITAGMNALIGIQQALLQRALTGCGSGIQVSLFDSAAELMAVPYLQARYGDNAPDRVGLKHPSIAPYGAFTCSDGREIVLSIQNEREWVHFCTAVLQQPELASDPLFDSNSHRTAHRNDLDARIQAVFSSLNYAQAVDRLTEAQTAFGSINSVHDLIQHPQLRTRDMEVHGRTVKVPAPPFITEWDDPGFPAVPAINQHSALPGTVPEALPGADAVAAA